MSEAQRIAAVRLLADLGVLYRLPATGLHEAVTNEYGVTYIRRGNVPDLTDEELENMNPLDEQNMYLYGIDYMRSHRHETPEQCKAAAMQVLRQDFKERLKATGDPELWDKIFTEAGW